MILTAALLACTPIARDGDTIRCGAELIRLLGIDAPELPGHCRRGRRCAPGNPRASRDRLADALLAGPVRIERFGKDRYGRTLAFVQAGGADLSCHQLAGGAAIYRRDWDRRGRLGRSCAAAGRSRLPR